MFVQHEGLTSIVADAEVSGPQETNPEELSAAIHTGCQAMAIANTLVKKGYNPQRVDVYAVCVLKKQDRRHPDAFHPSMLEPLLEERWM